MSLVVGMGVGAVIFITGMFFGAALVQANAQAKRDIDFDV